MKQNDGIAYEKPELIKYSMYGIVNGAGGNSNPGEQDMPGYDCPGGFLED